MYRQNEIVRHNGRWYLSLHDSNVGNQPTGNTDSHWELIVWSNGRLYPPDDVRLLTTDLYAVKGIGLVPAIDPATDRYFFKGRLKYKPKQ